MWLIYFSHRLESLNLTGDENCETGDLDLIQHMNIDMMKLTRLLNGMWNTLFSIETIDLSFCRSTKVEIYEKDSSYWIGKKHWKGSDKTNIKTLLLIIHVRWWFLRRFGIGWIHIQKNLLIFKHGPMLNWVVWKIEIFIDILHRLI